MPGFVKYKKGCTRLPFVSDKDYQLLAHGQWFSPGTPASSNTITGRHDIAESGSQHQKSNQSLKCIKNKKYLNFTYIVYVRYNDIITSLMRDRVRSNVAISFVVGVTDCCLAPIQQFGSYIMAIIS